MGNELSIDFNIVYTSFEDDDMEGAGLEVKYDFPPHTNGLMVKGMSISPRECFSYHFDGSKHELVDFTYTHLQKLK